jgi:hypothetical protein
MLSGKQIASHTKQGYQHRACKKKRGAVTKGHRYACHGPKQADDYAGEKITNTIDRRQHAERHAPALTPTKEVAPHRRLADLVELGAGKPIVAPNRSWSNDMRKQSLM